tara:strand:+ start:4209 stop:5393 length:1185 start_codon:yes stop_codon:yes gene_type:complete
MAIDYGNYAGSYANPDLSGLSRGIEGLKQKRLEANISKANKILEDHFDSAMKPLQGAVFGDLSALPDIGSRGYMDFGDVNPGKGFKALTEQHLGQRGKIKRLLDDSGLMGAHAYNQKFNEMLATYIPMLERKLENYQEVNKMTSSEMRDFIEKKGLKTLLINYGDKAGISREWAMPPRTWGDVGKEWSDWWNKPMFGKDVPIDKSKPLVAGGAGAAALGYGYKKGIFSGDKWKAPGFGARSGKILGSQKFVKDVSKALNKAGASSKALLDEARSRYEGLSKKHGGPGKNTKVGRNLRSTITKLDKRVTREIARPQNVSDAKKLWSRLLGKHGSTSGIRKALVKKVGRKKALLMAAKLGLGAAGTIIPEGLSTAAGVAAIGHTLYTVANALLGDE